MLGLAFLWALCFSVPAAALSLVRSDGNRVGVFAGNLFVDMILLTFAVNLPIFYFGMPWMALPGLIWVIVINLAVVCVVAWLVNAGTEAVDVTGPLALVLIVAMFFVWVVGYNGPHDPKAASKIVQVTEEAKASLPASSTSNMVVVSPDIAAAKAQSAMSSGLSGARNYNTFLQLGDGALQYVDGHMWYIYPLYFDGAGNKHRLHNVEPGYIMVSAEDPSNQGTIVEHYDGQYSMKVCVACGQSNELTRWIYEHGYKYKLDDPTLEIDDQGHPYWTVTIDKPQLGWTFDAPTSLLVVDAHTGAIKEYPLDKAPEWIDRVYSQQTAKDIAGWYGDYGPDGKYGWNGVGSSNANRHQVSSDPILVYTGDGHPDWRMLLTSYNNDTAVSRIVLMDAHSGAMRVYTPTGPMHIEGPVISAFESASGEGADNVRANRYRASDPTLHVIYGHLTWMVTYEPENSSSFVGIGFVDAYNMQSSNAVFGNSREEALQNYLTQLAKQATSNGNAPGQGIKTQPVSGTVKQVSWDISGGHKEWYISLVNDPTHVYEGSADSVGPALVMVQPGDPVNMQVYITGTDESARTMESFTDTNVPLKKPGA